MSLMRYFPISYHVPSKIAVLFSLIHLIMTSEPSVNDIVKAEVQSCSGCYLSRLPEVKAFIFEDVPKFNDVTFKNIHGALPELVLYSSDFKEVERISLKDLSREECNSLLLKKGFTMKEQKSEKEL